MASLPALDLPVSFTDDNAGRKAACRLNHAEAEGVNLPLLLGSGCYVTRNKALSFVSFWPSLLFLPGTAANIAFWSWARSRLWGQFTFLRDQQ